VNLYDEWPPAGAAPSPHRYRILNRASGKVEDRETEPTYDSTVRGWFHALAYGEQEFSIAIRDLVQQACGFFCKPDGEYVPLEGWNGCTLTDAEIMDRIHRIDSGENTREALRTNKRRYPLTELPWKQQRALIEQIERVKAEWKFERVEES